MDPHQTTLCPCCRRNPVPQLCHDCSLQSNIDVNCQTDDDNLDNSLVTRGETCAGSPVDQEPAKAGSDNDDDDTEQTAPAAAAARESPVQKFIRNARAQWLAAKRAQAMNGGVDANKDSAAEELQCGKSLRVEDIKANYSCISPHISSRFRQFQRLKTHGNLQALREALGLARDLELIILVCGEKGFRKLLRAASAGITFRTAKMLLRLPQLEKDEVTRWLLEVGLAPSKMYRWSYASIREACLQLLANEGHEHNREGSAECC